MFYFGDSIIVTQQSSSDSSTEREIIKRAVYIIVCVSKEQRILLTRKRPNEKDLYVSSETLSRVKQEKTKNQMLFIVLLYFEIMRYMRLRTRERQTE